MRIVLGAIAMSAALVATEAAAQGVNLTGPYQCIEGCVTARPGDFAFVTQNGWELNMVNEAGQASRAWVDYPGRIWIARANLGAIYSPDGMVIQFDNGTIWKRAPELPPRSAAPSPSSLILQARRANPGFRCRTPEPDVLLQAEEGQTPRVAPGAWPFCFALCTCREHALFIFGPVSRCSRRKVPRPPTLGNCA